MNTPPLILTLTLDSKASAYFTNLRNKHFPPERNFLEAHLTLFHKLPFDEPAVYSTLLQISQQQKTLVMEVAEPYNIGYGVAYKIISHELQQLHGLLQQQWWSFLSPQDKQKLRPHITVQNKVKPMEAKELEQQLKAVFKPFTIEGKGFSLWKYMGGPWELEKTFSFLPHV